MHRVDLCRGTFGSYGSSSNEEHGCSGDPLVKFVSHNRFSFPIGERVAGDELHLCWFDAISSCLRGHPPCEGHDGAPIISIVIE